MASSLPIPFPSGYEIQQKTNIGFQRNLWAPSSFDYNKFEDAFGGDAIDARYPAAKTNGTSAAVTHTEHTVNGGISLVTGTADDGYAGQGYGMNWKGDRGFLFEGALTTPAAITTLKFEIGVSDADDDAGAVNGKAAASATAGDFAVFVFDTDDDTNLAFISAKGGTVVATQDISAVTIATSTTYRFAIRVQDDNVTAWVNGTKVGAAHLIEGGTAVTPWAFAQARTGSASRTVILNKWRMVEPAFQ